MDNTFTNKYHNDYFLNQPTFIPTICNYSLTTIKYKAYTTKMLQNNTTLTIPITDLPNIMREEEKGFELIMPYFLKYNLSQALISITSFSIQDKFIMTTGIANLSFNKELSTFLEISNANILCLVKILNITTISSGVYKIYTEFVPPNMTNIISTQTSIKIVVCEALIPTIVDTDYVFTSNYIMSETLKLNNNTLFNIYITSMTNCYDSISKEVVCNCIGNSISNSSSINFIEDNDNLFLNNGLERIFLNNEINKIENPETTLPIVRNNKYFLTKELIYNSEKKDIYTASKIYSIYPTINSIVLESTSSLIIALKILDNTYPDIWKQIKIKVNSKECAFIKTSTLNIVINAPATGNVQFFKKNNLVEIYTDPTEIIPITESLFFKNLDFIIRLPVCTSDFLSFEYLDSVDAVSHDKKVESKNITSKLNNNLKQIINISSSLSMTEYERIIDNQYFYFSLEKEIPYNLISYTIDTGVVRNFLNCIIMSTSLTEDADVNKKQFSITYEKELKYNVIDFTEIEEL